MASEKRLILVDAHKLKQTLVECFDDIKSIRPTRLPLMHTLLVWMGLCNQPTVDAAFVVRCGKCKFAEKDGIHQVSLKCTRFKTGQYTHRVQPDDFCSYGERREGE